MDKISKWVKSKKELIFIILMVLIWINGCQTNKSFKANIKNTEAKTIVLQKTTDSLLNIVKELPTEATINNYFAIEGYRISKRILYDNNLIVRTKERPDDRMNEYDNKIEKLQDNVKVVRKK